MFARFVPGLLTILASCGGAAAPGTARSATMQFAFYHFHDERIQVAVDGRIMFDRMVSVAPDNARLGLAAVVQIDLPACSDIVVQTPQQRIAERICLAPQTRSIVVDGGPPLTIVAQERFHGVD